MTNIGAARTSLLPRNHSGISRAAGAVMEKRVFTDPMGNRWMVWEVYPRLVERRLMRERRTRGRFAAERRHVPVGRTTQPREILHGWLAFQSLTVRRRYRPTPDNWEGMSDDELRALLAESTLSSRPRR